MFEALRLRHLPLVLFLSLIIACDAPTDAEPATSIALAPSLTAQPVSTGAQPTPISTSTATSPPATPTLTPTATLQPPATHTPRPTPCAEAAGAIKHGTFDSAVAGGLHAYNIYLPPCYTATGSVFPVLYLFAGNIHDEHKWLELGIKNKVDEAIGDGEIVPLIVVMPDGGWVANNTSGGPGSFESLVLDELIPHIQAHYCAWDDPAGRAIGGLSRGGYWALEIAFRFPERFISVGGHSAALLDTHAGPALNPQITAVSNNLGDLRIYLDIGADDYVRANTIRLHEDMLTAGVSHDWQLNEGRHEDAYWSAHLSDYLHWYALPWIDDRDAYPPCAA